MNTKPENDGSIRVYDSVTYREEWKIMPSSFWIAEHRTKIHQERVSQDVIVEVLLDKEPTRVLINGQLYEKISKESV